MRAPKAKRRGQGVAAFSAFLLLVAPLVIAGNREPVTPSPRDKCPVCGMFVAKYPDWLVEIIFKDGSVAFFDGVKDLFKYYFDLKKYNPKKTRDDIQAIYVTEYYGMKFIDAYGAFFVAGSDVYGPMGRELIPFETEGDAKEFMKDHQGKKILTFKDIEPSTIKGLD